MIRKLTIEGFKSIRLVEGLDLGRVNLFIGPNASGKSNFFDALRVLQGIGFGFTVDEIFNGRPASSTSISWDPIRGGGGNACFVRKDSSEAAVGDIRFVVELDDMPGGRTASYSVVLRPATGRIVSESLSLSGKPVFDTTPFGIQGESQPTLDARYISGKSGQPPRLSFVPTQSIIHQLPKKSYFSSTHSELFERFAKVLGNMQSLDPLPTTLREYATAARVLRMGGHGENFAALAKHIDADAESRQAFLGWLRELRPHEIEDFEVLSGAVGDSIFAIKEGNKRAMPAPSLSDGTLRFAAITAAFFQPDMPDRITLEEIENGIHASRLRLLVELLRSQSAASRTQVFATTHSPVVLAWLSEQDYKTTFWCSRDDETGESRIVSLGASADFARVVRKQPIAELFAEGWMESTL